ncbi:phage terminase small subunit [Kiloniella laminariae]|uniref:Phage terminase small subunit n=1 Tax=Kiloniella laminariae TaxID=454162 RepID=A0ABT4LL90_9PROT|nr:phage terminase small subunit [Kiloniella laminariae]MCZ4281715.1 phage terminase small subunit [Kiloniella laminariae]
MSLARKHFEKVTAEISAGASKEKGQNRVHGSTTDQMLARLRAHEVILKSIQSRNQKIIKKREFLPEYEGYVDGILAAGTGLQDLVVTTVMVWRFDVGDLSGALQLASYVLEHDLQLPERFARSAATLVLEEIADQVEQLQPTGDLALTYIDAMNEAFALTDGTDMPDEVRSKAFKYLGYLLYDSNPELALENLKAAFDLNPKCGVKTKIGQLEKLLKPSQEEPATASEPDPKQKPVPQPTKAKK